MKPYCRTKPLVALLCTTTKPNQIKITGGDRFHRPLILVILVHVFISKGMSQISITGPSCVTPGTSYQYIISGNWNQKTSMSWSITGGVITGTTNSFTSGTPKPNIYITWSASGSLSLTTGNPNGSISKSVTASTALSAGSITN